MQNEYNTPTAQRDRWEAAGFNPFGLAAKGDSGKAAAIAPYQEQSTNVARRPIDITPAGSALANYYQLQQLEGEARSAKAKGDRDEWLYSPRSHKTQIPIYDSTTNTISFQDANIISSPFQDKEIADTSRARMRAFESEFRLHEIGMDIRGKEATTVYNEWRTRLATEFGLTPQDTPFYRVLFNILTDNGMKLNHAMDSEGLAAGMALYEKFGDLTRIINLIGIKGLGGAKRSGQVKPVSPRLDPNYKPPYGSDYPRYNPNNFRGLDGRRHFE